MRPPPFALLPCNLPSPRNRFAALAASCTAELLSRRRSRCNQNHFQTVKFYAARIAASSNSAQQPISAAAVTSLWRRSMLACRQVHLRLTALHFRPSLFPSASALQFGISGKNVGLAKGNSPMPWARCAPIYRRLSVALLFRPFRRSNAPHQRSALTLPICFAEAVKKSRAAQKAADAK